MVAARAFVGLRPAVHDLRDVLALGRSGRGRPPRPSGVEHLLGFVPEGGPQAARIEHATRAWHDPDARPFPLARDAARGVDVLRLDAPDGTAVLGVIVLVQTDDDALLPHEAVVSGPTDDRHLLRAALRLDTAPITVLRRSASSRSVDPSAMAIGPPLQDAAAHDGVRHRLWRIEAPDVVAAVLSDLEDDTALVADGHHRLAAAKAHAAATGDPAARWLLAFVTEPSTSPRLRPSGRVTDLQHVWRTALDGGVLPAKSTRFEPKPRAGLVLRSLDEPPLHAPPQA